MQQPLGLIPPSELRLGSKPSAFRPGRMSINIPLNILWPTMMWELSLGMKYHCNEEIFRFEIACVHFHSAYSFVRYPLGVVIRRSLSIKEGTENFLISVCILSLIPIFIHYC